MQVLSLAMLIGALHSALKDRVVALDRVRVNVAATPLVSRVIDRAAALKLLTDRFVLVRLVDLPIALGLMAAIGAIPSDTQGFMVVGELGWFARARLGRIAGAEIASFLSPSKQT